MSTVTKKKFRPILVFGFIIPAILLIIYLIGLYIYLYGIQNYNSGVYLDKYLDLIKENKYKELIEYNNIELGEFDDENSFISYIDSEYGENRAKYIKIKDEKNSTKDTDVYKVQFGNGKIKKFEVNKTENKKLLFFNEWNVIPPDANPQKENIKIYASSDTKIFINDKEVNDKYLTDEVVELKQFKGIHDKNHVHPKMICYEVDNIFVEPTVKADSINGGSCDIVEKDGVYTVTNNMSDAEAEEFKKLAEDFAKKYSAYISEDCTLATLRKYLMNDTDFYDRIVGFYNGWFPLHTSYGYEDIEFGKMISYDENHASVQIKFNFYVTHKWKEKRRDYPIAYDIFFTNVDGKWLVSDVKNF